MITPARASLAKRQELQLLTAFRTLTAERRRSLLEYAVFLALRAGRSNRVVIAPGARPKHETVVQAIRRLTRTYPLLERSRLLAQTSRCLAAHMIDGRAAADVIDELEALYARAAKGHTHK